MKKIISIFLIVLLMFSLFSNVVLAQDFYRTNSFVSQDDIIEEVYGLYNSNNYNGTGSRATGLITKNLLKLTKTTSSLKIQAETLCSSDVTKCGFTYVKLQRLINGTWTDYTTYCYYDQYSQSNGLVFLKTIYPPSGYSYRVICEHYAEKPKLIFFKETQTIYNATSSLSF
ncbi:MAG TPA: hypothetical protein GXZ23_07925 [Clostridiales bacterium]|nr:hypothetical protein [Clostridiales bacterium]